MSCISSGPNPGNTMLKGSVFINTSTNNMMVSDGSSWIDAKYPSVDQMTAVLNRLESIEKHLCILTEDDEKISEQHETLKQAYREYKVLEKLILGGEK